LRICPGGLDAQKDNLLGAGIDGAKCRFYVAHEFAVVINKVIRRK
jgi:hypothetical protein